MIAETINTEGKASANLDLMLAPLPHNKIYSNVDSLPTNKAYS